LVQIEDNLVPDPIRNDADGNAFKIWLKAKGQRMLKDDEIKSTRFLKKLYDL